EHERRRRPEAREREDRGRHRPRALGRARPAREPRLRRTLRPPRQRAEPVRAGRPHAGFPGAPLASTLVVLASLTSSVTTLIGAYAGRPLLEERGRWFHLDRAKLDRADRWFERWGDWAVFLGRLTPVVRSFISIPAGVVRMPIGRFTVLTFLGSAIWCFAIAGAGWALGSSYKRFHHDFAYVEYAVVAAVIVFVVWLILRWRSSAAQARSERS